MLLGVLLLSIIMNISGNPTCTEWCHRTEKRHVSYLWGDPCCGDCYQPYTKDNPLPVYIVNSTVNVQKEYQCPVDSPFRPCYRLDPPPSCRTDQECQITHKDKTLKCCYDTCIDGHVCKPGLLV